MTEEEAKSISLELLRPMVREHELAMKAALEDDRRATLNHLGRMSLYAVKTSLTWRSILLHLRRSCPYKCVDGEEGRAGKREAPR